VCLVHSIRALIVLSCRLDRWQRCWAPWAKGHIHLWTVITVDRDVRFLSCCDAERLQRARSRYCANWKCIMRPVICSSGVNSVIDQAWNSLPALKRDRKKFRPDELVFTEACAPLNGGQAWAQTRKCLSWIRMTRTKRQDARRSGKEDARHSLFLGGCLFGFYGEHNSKIRKGSCREVMWRGLVVTWRLIRDWSYLLTFCVSLEKLARAEHSK